MGSELATGRTVASGRSAASGRASRPAVPTFAAQIAALGAAVKAWLHFDEASGTTFADATGNGHTATLVGAMPTAAGQGYRTASLTPGDGGASAYFAGSTNYCTLNNLDAIWNGQAQFWMAVWHQGGDQNNHLCGVRHFGNGEFYLYRTAANQIEARFIGADGTNRTLDVGYEYGRPGLLVFTVDITNHVMRLYGRGELLGTLAIPTATASSLGTEQGIIGQNGGRIDEVVFATGTLTPTDVQTLWRGGRQGRTATLASAAVGSTVPTRYLAQTGKQPAFFVGYSNFGETFATMKTNNGLDANVANSVINAVTWGPNGAAGAPGTGLDAWVAAGNADATINQWIADYKAWSSTSKRLIVRFAHECNITNYAWSCYTPAAQGNSVTDYIAMWQHVWGLFQNAGVNGSGGVQWWWCPNCTKYATANGPLETCYPGDAYVDYVGLDGYPTGSNPGDSFTGIFDADYRRVVAMTSKPFLVGEVGQVNSTCDRAAWFRSAFEQEIPESFPTVVGLDYYDQNVNGAFAVDGDAATLAAWQGVNRDYRWRGRP